MNKIEAIALIEKRIMERRQEIKRMQEDIAYLESLNDSDMFDLLKINNEE